VGNRPIGKSLPVVVVDEDVTDTALSAAADAVGSERFVVAAFATTGSDAPSASAQSLRHQRTRAAVLFWAVHLDRGHGPSWPGRRPVAEVFFGDQPHAVQDAEQFLQTNICPR
jgi:hypothetical protein